MSEQLTIDFEEEIWKDIPDFEGFYQASSLGRIRSIDRMVNVVTNGENLKKPHKGKVLTPLLNQGGYYHVRLSKLGKIRIFLIHRLVLLTFTEDSELMIDHKNGIRTDNRLSNLEYVSHRENVSRGKMLKKWSSKYTGVSFRKQLKKWQAYISINKRKIHLGFFVSEYDAHLAYQSALESHYAKVGCRDTYPYKNKNPTF